ncbi:MAG: Mor transcription activator family protein [Eubacteriales bacterium]
MANMVDLEAFKQIIGEQLFQEVVNKLAGMNLYIPKNIDCKYPNRVKRNEQIRFDYHTGMSVQDIASKYSLGTSRLYDILEFKNRTL